MAYGDLTRSKTSDKILRDKLLNPCPGGFFRVCFMLGGGWGVSKSPAPLHGLKIVRIIIKTANLTRK